MLALVVAVIAVAAPDLVWERTPAAAMSTSPTAVAFSADGTTLVVGGSGYAEGWDARTLARRWHVEGGPGFTRAVATLHRSRQAVIGDDTGSVVLRDLDTGAVIRALGKLPGWVSSVAVSDDDALVAAVDLTGALAVWSLPGGDRVDVALGEPAPSRLESVAFTHRGDRLVLAGNFAGGSLRVIGLRDATVWSPPAAQGEARTYGQSVAVSPDDRLVAVGWWGGAIEVRDLADGRLRWSDTPSKNWVGPIRFVDATRLVAAAPEALRVYDVGSGRTLASRPDLRSSDLAVSPDGRSVVSVLYSQARVRRLDARTLADLDDPRERVAAADQLGFTPDGSVLATGSTNAPGVVFLDAADGHEVARLPDEPCVGLGGLRFDRQARRLIVSSCDYGRGVSVYDWPSLRPVPGLQGIATNGEAWFTADGSHVVVMDAFEFGAARALAVPTGRDDTPQVDARWLDPRATRDPDVALALFGHRSVVVTHWLAQSQPQAPAVRTGDLGGSWLMGGYSADGRTTATLDGDSITVRRDGQATVAIRVEGVRSIAIAPAGDRVAIGLADGTVRMVGVK